MAQGLRFYIHEQVIERLKRTSTKGKGAPRSERFSNEEKAAFWRHIRHICEYFTSNGVPPPEAHRHRIHGRQVFVYRFDYTPRARTTNWLRGLLSSILFWTSTHEEACINFYYIAFEYAESTHDVRIADFGRVWDLMLDEGRGLI